MINPQELNRLIRNNLKEILSFFLLFTLFYSPIIDSIKILLFTLINNDNIGDLMQGVGIALLSILIPLAIAILSGFLDLKSKLKEEKDGESNPDLEIRVILDLILNIKSLISHSILIFIPPLFWQESSINFRILELVIWFIGFYFLANRILYIAKWIKASDLEFHYLYLERLEDKEDMKIVWRSIWSKQITTHEQIKLLEIFSVKIDSLLKSENK